MKGSYRQPSKILIVEDDVEHKFLLATSLSGGSPGYTVSTAENRAEFVRCIEHNTFDCVVLDFNLSDCRADELLLLLAETAPNCPAIVVSSSNDQDVVIASMRSGSVDFVPKDQAIQGAVLRERIEYALSKSRTQQLERRRIERRHRHLLELADKDPLTGLANRRFLERTLRGRRFQAQDRRDQMSVILLDLDHFKAVNDQFGHDAGDAVLRHVSSLILRKTRESDVSVRWGGEEFLLLWPHTSLAHAMAQAEELRHAIGNSEVQSGDHRIRISASFGLLNLPRQDFCSESIGLADAALYVSKKRGRNCLSTHELVLFEKTVERIPKSSLAEQRLHDTLEQSRDVLGPTQFEHLTSHSKLVSEVGLKIGSALTLDSQAFTGIGFGGLAHDLGKFLIPESVLAKPASLSVEEFALVNRHASDGAEMSRLVGADAETSDYIRYHHHQRLDHIDRCSVPLGARILKVSDAYVAMCTDRSYQRARSHEAALAELTRCKGKEFDADVVDALCQCKDVPALD